MNKKKTIGNPDSSIAIGRDYTVYIVWQDRPTQHANTEIYFSYKTPGDTFTDPVNITNTPSKCERGPTVDVDREDNLYCIWARKDGLYFSYRTKGGDGHRCSYILTSIFCGS